ncbi:MAG: YicC family protein [Hyphomonadaceae bacterium]|nr:YicC family protein [Clostridia bacterium]
MIKSMTGFGRGEHLAFQKNVSIEIKSVNHRYFDFSLRASRIYGYLEDRVKEYIKQTISRGKVDVHLSVESIDDEVAYVQVNEALAAGYVEAMRTLSERFGLRDDVTVSTLTRFPDVLTVEKKEDNEDELWQAVKGALDLAILDFLAYRQREGLRLQADFTERVTYMEGIVSEIQVYAPQLVDEYRVKIDNRIRDLLQNVSVDENRLLTEVAIFADKVNVTEEIVRLKSHFVEFRSLLDQPQPVGRKIDFLIQEMNREVNTIGSKSSDLSITKLVVELKSEMEKMREQIQNIE